MPPRTHQKSQRGADRSSTSFQQVQQQLKFVDLVIEVLDARAPASSRHPESTRLFGNKPRMIVLTKDDLADRKSSQLWQNVFASEPNQSAISLSLKFPQGKNKLVDAILKLTVSEQERLKNKGLQPRPCRVCVVGIPNVGKSSLINWLIGKKRVRVGDLPGITKGPQWVRVHPRIELLDTPGLLPPTQFKPEVVFKLALLNLISPGSYDAEEIATRGLKLMNELYKDQISTELETASDSDIDLEAFGRLRNFLKPGGQIDITRAAATFLTDLRSGKLGPITLDRPD
jgi:ribosome biogenesis GTPase A